MLFLVVYGHVADMCMCVQAVFLLTLPSYPRDSLSKL